AGLFQQPIGQRGLAVIDMGDDGKIAQVLVLLGHQGSSEGGGDNTRGRDAQWRGGAGATSTRNQSDSQPVRKPTSANLRAKTVLESELLLEPADGRHQPLLQ